MMTGQPYKSPPEPATETAATTKSEEGRATTTTTTITPPLSSPIAAASAAFRGVSTLSAKLQRQRLANQVYKDAWLATEPTLKGSITPAELLGTVVPAVPGLVVAEADLGGLVDPEDAGRGITCKRSFSSCGFCVSFFWGGGDRLGEGEGGSGASMVDWNVRKSVFGWRYFSLC